MRRPHRAEAPAIGGENRGHVQSFGHGDDGCVHEAEREVGIRGHEVGSPRQVGVRQRFHLLAAGNPPDERRLDPRAQPRPDEPGGLGKDGDGNVQRALVRVPPITGPLVPCVPAIGQGVERAGVGQDGQRWGSVQRKSSTWLEMSERPESPIPTHDGNVPGRGAGVAT